MTGAATTNHPASQATGGGRLGRTVAAAVRALAVDLLRLRSVRSTWGFVVASMMMAAMSVLLQVFVVGSAAGAPLTVSETADRLTRALTLTPLFAVLLAVVATAGHTRHHTMTTTLLLSPRRLVWLAAHTGATVLIVGVLSIGTCLFAAVVGLLAAVGLGIPATPVLLAMLPRAALLCGVSLTYAVMGVGVAALVGDQTLTVAFVLVWDLVVELLLAGALPAVAPVLPGRIVSALTSGSGPGAMPIGPAVLLLGVYALGLWAAGAYRLRGRDITA